VAEQKALTEHIYGFYQGLMGAKGEPHQFAMAHNLWDEDNQISEGEN
jgi:hypothetical protein